MKDWTRYSCQLALPGFDEQAQQKLHAAKVLIAGVGGLGCPAAQYLVATGIGTIGLADHDTISTKNLHRQILYTPADVGMKKVVIAERQLKAQNPDVHIIPLDIKIIAERVMEMIGNYDMVVDCTDNFATRYLLNDACVLAGKPLIYGAIYRYEGQVAVWNVTNADGTRSPNYRDLYPDVNAAAIPDCAEGGVIPTIAGMIGCIQANEVIKYITGTGELLVGQLMLFDARTLQSRIINLGNVTKTNITRLQAPVQVQEMTVTDLQLLMDDCQLIDVRTTEERAVFNIGGLHIQLSEISIATITVSNKPIVCYCASGKRSAEAVKILSDRFPHAKIYSLKGGIEAWSLNQG